MSNGNRVNQKMIAITGPTASGKSIFARQLAQIIGRDKCVVICQDDYYRDWSYLSKKRRKMINFDDIRAFDFQLLVKHIRRLKNGESIHKPRYCFVESKRLTAKKKTHPKPIVIVEGLMPLLKVELRRLIDFKVYIDVDNAISLSRRLIRDTSELGESIDSVCKRYFNEVLPMQNKYVEQQKQWADLVVDGSKRITDKEIKRIIKVIGGRW